MQPVGQLDDDHPDVCGHSQDHLPHVLGLAFLTAGELHLADLGDPVHDIRRFTAEEPFNFREFGIRVFYGVVKQTGHHTDHIHFHLCQDVGHLQGVGQIGFPGKTDLTLVDLG